MQKNPKFFNENLFESLGESLDKELRRVISNQKLGEALSLERSATQEALTFK